MKGSIQFRTLSLHVVALLAACFSLWRAPNVFGVVPPPDGGYPNFTTAEGTNALKNLTTAVGNTAIGWYSLFSDATGGFNTGVGAGTLVLNTADANTATGTAALLLNTTGRRNTANGTATLVDNSTGEDITAVGAFALNANTASGNTAVGSSALLNNTTGGTVGNVGGVDVGPNVAVGYQALESNTLGSANTAVGYRALQNFTTGGSGGSEQLGLCTAVGFQALANTTGIANSGFGYQALMSNTSGEFNTAIGLRALLGNTTGTGNTANGADALNNNATGRYNTAIGVSALSFSSAANDNTAIGAFALLSNSTGQQNTAIGSEALRHNGGGSFNTAIGTTALVNNVGGQANTAMGYFALFDNTAGNGNTAFGNHAGEHLTGSGNVCIGDTVGGVAGQSNVTRIRNIGSTPIIDGTSVVISSTGGIGDGILGIPSSSRRYKEDIKSMDNASETLFALKPVTFRTKRNIDQSHVKHYGLIAEDVATIDPDLVVYNPDGTPETLRFNAINAMLLNEFLKEHKTVQELKSTVLEQQSIVVQQRESFERRLADQEKQIKALMSTVEKVNAQLEVNNSAPRVTANER
jgi:hypothetical protein